MFYQNRKKNSFKSNNLRENGLGTQDPRGIFPGKVKIFKILWIDMNTY